MKHPATRAFYQHWEQQRGDAGGPERSDFDLDPVRHLLADMFILALDGPFSLPMRVAGTRVCALVGEELKGRNFLDLWPDDRGQLSELVSITSEESLATVAGVQAATETGAHFFLELLLLPFAPRAYTVVSISGLIVPLTAPALVGRERVTQLALTSWRHQGHRKVTMRQRAIRRIALMRGMMVYEGLFR